MHRTRRPWLRPIAVTALALTVSSSSHASPWPPGPAGAPTGGGLQSLPSPVLDPVATAKAWLASHAASLGLGADALAAARVRLVHDLGHGPIVVSFEQRIASRLVMHERLGVLLARDGRVVTAMGHLHPAASPDRRGDFALTSRDAVVAALADLGPLTGASPFHVDPAALVDAGRDEGGFERLALAPLDAGGLLLGRPARARAVWFPRGPALVPAYQVEVRAEVPGRLEAVGRSWVVDARDGAILEREDQVQSERWRVWASTKGDRRPLPMPTEDFLPYPGETPDHKLPAFVAPNLVNISGREAWLPQGAVQTSGNNVDAYVDINAPDGFSNGDLRALETANGVYDRTYDLNAEPDASPDQLMATATQLFYLTNWLHDWFYESGFDEEAGNAQVSNFGRGGAGGDPLLAEADDFSVTDNANMQTPEDGASPIMQLGIYSASATRTLRVQGHEGNVAIGGADFGERAFHVVAPIVRVRDEGDPATDACDELRNDVTGAIALVDRGKCSFESKARRVGAAGAVAVIIVNNNPGEGPNPLVSDQQDPPAQIPAVSVSYEDGQLIGDLLAQGAVRGELDSVLGVRPTSAIEASTAAHEWGHYLHHRLVDCMGYQCSAASEGWGDFIAMHLALEEGDDTAGACGEGAYTAAPFTEDAGWFGIRRYPYSTDFGKNPLTLASMGADATFPDDAPISPVMGTDFPNEVHNAGEVWAQMMFEAYAAIIADAGGEAPRLTFAEAQRRMGDYVVASMILQPPNPDYLEQRDALIAAAEAGDPADARAFAAAFAKRGAGSCAVAPNRDDFQLLGAVESYDLKSKLVVASVVLSDDRASCDGVDGALEAGEGGVVRVVVRNPSAVALADGHLAVSSTTAALAFPSGAELAIPEVPAFGEVTIDVPVTLDAALTEPTQAGLVVTATSPSSCEATSEVATGPWTNAVSEPSTSTTESVEEPDALAVWQLDADAARVWSVGEPEPGAHAFVGIDFAGPADASLVWPPLVVGTEAPLVVTFSHAYSFEWGTEDTRGGPVPLYYDGGVIEVSADDGATWEDASAHATVPYGQAIVEDAGNVLAGRDAFTAENHSWPALDPVTLDFGDAYAGQTIRLRFRIGTDFAAGAPGWVVDDIAVQGLVGTPFSSLAASPAPVAYLDLDGDGLGGKAVSACPLPEHAVLVGGDCNDRAADVYPGAPELCDGLDNDCDGKADQGLSGLGAFYVDGDGDGYGAGRALIACAAPPKTVARAGDCNDHRGDIHPGAPEGAGGSLDLNCDGAITPKADEGCAGGGADAGMALTGIALALAATRRRGAGARRLIVK